MTTLTEIRTEYMRSLSDAYAGGPAVREQAWNRLLDLIEQYAHRPETASSSPTMPPDTATAPAVAPDATGRPKPRAAKPTARKAATP